MPFWYVREPPLRSVDPGGTIGDLFPDDASSVESCTSPESIVAPGRIRQSGGLRYVFGDPGAVAAVAAPSSWTLLRDAGLAAEPDAKFVRRSGLSS